MGNYFEAVFILHDLYICFTKPGVFDDECRIIFTLAEIYGKNCTIKAVFGWFMYF